MTRKSSAEVARELEFFREREHIAQGKRVQQEEEDDERTETEDIEKNSGEKSGESYSEGLSQIGSEEMLMNLFRGMNFAGTRYPHWPTMDALGITREVEQLLEQSDLLTLVSNPGEGYQEETCHFLSTLQVRLYQDEPETEANGELGYIYFKIRKQEYTMELSQLDLLYGFKQGPGVQQDYSKRELNELWELLGGKGKHKSSRSKCSEIRSPWIRYFHKAIANTMFARNITGGVNDGEIKMLDKALEGFVSYTTAKNQRLDRGMLADRANTGNSIVLIRQLLTYKEYATR